MKRNKRFVSAALATAFAATSIAGTAAIAPQSVAQTGQGTVKVKAVSDRTGAGKYEAKGFAGATFSAFKVNDEKSVPSANAKPVATAQSGSDGVATLSGLPAGNYYIQMTATPDGYEPLKYITTGNFDGADPGTRSGYFVKVEANNTYDLTKEQKPGNNADAPSAYGWTSGVYPVIKKNPRLTEAQCKPLDVTVIADLSYSTKPQFNNFQPSQSNYYKALNNLVDSLAKSGATLRIGTFAGNAPSDSLGFIPTPLNPVKKQGPTSKAYNLATKEGVQAAKDRISKGDNSAPLMYSNWQGPLAPPNTGWKQGTNWDAGMYQQVKDGIKSDMVLFLTDGMPTIDSPQIADKTYGIGRTKSRNLEYAVASANAIKSMGTRVMAGYIDNNTPIKGQAPGTGRTYAVNNLAAISGNKEGLDYFSTDWQNIGQKLAEVPKAACDPDNTVPDPNGGDDPELKVSKDVDTKAEKVGDKTTFSIKVKNSSSKTEAKNVVVEDNAIHGLTDVKFINPSTGSATNNVWKVGNIKPGETFEAKVEAKATGDTVDNAVSTHADNSPKKDVPNDQIQRNNGNVDGDTDKHDRVDYTISPRKDTPNDPKANIKVAKKVDESKAYKVGDSVTYTMTVFNDSKVKAQDVKVEDLPSAGLSNVTLSKASDGKVSGTTWKIASMKPGAKETVKVTATIAGDGTVDNVASVSAKGLPPRTDGEIQRNNDDVVKDNDQRDRTTISVADDPQAPPAPPAPSPISAPEPASQPSTVGPKVNTGGDVEGDSLWTKIKGIFS